jgi:hypothetical protein
MNLCYYVTSHGFGHGVRTVSVCNEFSPQVNLYLKTALPKQFFQEEINRTFSYHAAEFDCGCMQKDGVTVDIEETVRRYTAIAKRNQQVLGDEIAWVKENRIDGIFVDTTPFGLEIAHHAGIPSITVTNFTWFDIYKDYVKRIPDFKPVVDKVKEQYGMSSIYFALDRPIDTSYFKKVKPMPVVGRKGVNIREKIISHYHLNPSKNLGLIYTGNFGFDSADWGRLESFIDWEFLGVYPLPGNPRNFHLASKKDFKYQDLSASVDCVISKIGYGTFSESIIHGVPIIYVPRGDFSEFPVLEARLKEWGHAYRLEQDDFYRLNWGEQLAAVIDTKRPEPYPINGAKLCAEGIEQFISGS